MNAPRQMRRLFVGWCWTLACAAALLALPPAAHANSPELRRVEPAGYQRGQTVELTLTGRRLDDPQEVIFYEPGITVEKMEAENNEKRDDRRLKLTVKIADDARIGEHRLRVRTRRGWTDLRTFWVSDTPVADEKEPNSDFDEPQPIDFNTTVHGVVKNEDVDYYRIEAKKGQRISVEVNGIRLGGEMFDPYVAIMDTERFQLAAADDTALLRQDPYAQAKAPEDGEYIIAVRESAYGGSNDSFYRLHVGDFPRPAVAYPMGGQAGKKLKVTYLDDASGPIEAEVKLPDEPRERLGIIAEQDGRPAPSPNWLRVSPFPNVLESEPNNNWKQATDTEGGTTLPAAFNGVVGSTGDHDYFKFTGKKGQTIEARVFGRSLGSPLDPVVNLYHIKDGKDLDHLKGNDDSGGRLDSYIREKLPADGAYVIRVRDHLDKGGPTYAYRIEVTPADPALALEIPNVSRDDTQSRQFVSVPRGNRWAVLIRANRDNFGGDLKFTAEGLPEGITMHAPTMPGRVSTIPIVFEATKDAPIEGELITLQARHAERKEITGTFSQRAVLVSGNPNREPYYSTRVDRMAAGVTAEAPFKVRIVEPKIPLLRDGRMELKVVIERDEGFDNEVILEMPFRPPGMGTRSRVKVPKGKSEAIYPLNANGRAATGEWPLVVLAHADMDGGPLYVSSQIATLEIADHLATGKIQMVAAEQGESVKIVCDLNQKTPFEGEAKIELRGLPHKVTTEIKKISKDDEKVVFPVNTDAKSPTGKHKSLFCRITLMRDGEPMVQDLAGGGVLRIDKPRPEPKKVAKKEPKKKEKKPEKKEPEKQLSRLEQLRLELAKQSKAGGG